MELVEHISYRSVIFDKMRRNAVEKRAFRSILFQNLAEKMNMKTRFRLTRKH